jgi:DNA modification methylase
MVLREKSRKRADKRKRPQQNSTRYVNERLDDSLFLSEHLVGHVDYVAPETLKSYRNHARIHGKNFLNKLERSLCAFGFVFPILVDSESNVISGHARAIVAKRLGLTEVPIIRIHHLTPSQVSALRIADNRLSELGEWDEEKLAVVFQGLLEADFEVELTGFETPEIDMTIEAQLAPVGASAVDEIPPSHGPQVTVLGDLWNMDEHRVHCADARDPDSYVVVLQNRRAQMGFTDPPYNVKIKGNVGGLGAIQHDEFVMASGEMTVDEYEYFLTAFVRNLIYWSEDGSVHYLFIDWRHLQALTEVCNRYFDQQLNLCIWVKSNGGMGSFYRSQHEVVLVFKKGKAAHINNIQLGKYGRNRTNVWFYEGCNSLTPDRRANLKLHPTVKPVALVADAIRDSSKRNGLILDPFLGSGTTVIACEQTGRTCAGLEMDPRYIDVTVRRWQAFTGNQARHSATGMTFDEMAKMRHSDQSPTPPPSSVEEV